MINEAFFDTRKQRVILDSILSGLKEGLPDKQDVFSADRYIIIQSDNNFSGRYSFKEDCIYIDHFFIYDMLCSNDTDNIKNVLIHEEAHRQVRLSGTESSFADHWDSWLNEYLSMGGKPPQVYLKRKLYEWSAEYKDVKESDIENIIILEYDGSRESSYLLSHREKIDKPFILLTDKNIMAVKNRYKL